MSQTQDSSQAAFKEWYIGGLQALVSANEIGEKTTEKLKKYITSPELMDYTSSWAEAAAEQAKLIKQFLKEAGGEPTSMTDDIMVGIDKAADKIAQSEDKDVRDAGVVTTAQLALHYYIASYGGLASTAKHLGMSEQAEKFSDLTDEAKKADQWYTQFAEETVNKKAMA